MIEKNRWRRTARQAIELALDSGRVRGLAGPKLLAQVDAAYPFGTRENHPYRIWLKARRELCWDLLPETSKAGHKTPELMRLKKLEDDMRRTVESQKG